MNKKEIERVKKELESIETFKNVTLDYNKEKDIFDVYIKIRRDEAEVKDILNESKKIDYVYCDFGIFEIMFHPADTEEALEYLKDNF